MFEVSDSDKIELVDIPVFLPHELLHTLVHAGPEQAGLTPTQFCTKRNGVIHADWLATPPKKTCQLGRSLLGGWGSQELAAFWKHLDGFEEWSSHPILNNPTVDRRKLLPATFHVDGVEFFANTEFVVWSLSSGIANGNEPKLNELVFNGPGKKQVDLRNLWNFQPQILNVRRPFK